jgi:SAM-dependent methyltransferase
MLRNVAFDPELVRYSPGYENSLHFSPSFRSFAEDLARRLIARYDLRGKAIVDVGCGRGDFLALLCAGTGNRGVGYDPSYPRALNGGNPRFVRGFYAGEPADFICCRHVLEHVEDPRALLRSLAPDATVYFEMPDGGYMLREAAIWDLIYEHPNHFTAPALRRLFEDAGYGVLDLGSSFGGQYLYIEAARGRNGHPPGPSAADLAPHVSAFADAHRSKLRAWEERLGELSAAGRTVAVWGAGSKGVSFLNTVPGGDAVAHVVDLNPRKHGRYVPGTGQRIVAPDALCGTNVDAVLVMNRLYTDEIHRTLDNLGVRADLLIV